MCYIEHKNSKNSNININRRVLISMDPTKSVINWKGFPDIAEGTTVTVIVTAKDTSGILISTGGENLMLKVSNICNKVNDYYWSPSDLLNLISININVLMTDNNDGTYSASFTAPTTRKFLIQIYSWTSISSGLFAHIPKSLPRVLR